MKVLHIVSVSFSLKYFIGNQFNYFGQKGYDFTVVCTPSKELYSYSDQMAFKVFPLQILRSINPIQDILSIYKLYKFLKKEKFDIVIAHSPKGGLIGMVAAYFAQVPKRIFFRHGLVFETSFGIKKRLLILIEKIISFCSRKVVNVSPSIEEKVKVYNLNPKDKNVILGKGTCNGVNVNRFLPSSKRNNLDKIVVGFVGRLSNDKGVTELIDAWKIVEKKFNNIQLVLIGPIDQRDSVVSDTIQVIQQSNTINYIGEVEDTSIYYREMDIFILPSYREGFPTVTLEASASELPIITTKRTGCIDSIIENVTGIFTELTSEDIADSIAYYINNPNIRIEHGINGRKFVVNNFSEEIIYDEIEKKLLTVNFK